ncbi:MAG: AAA family ATPase [Fervidicoccaceae archaeon]|jgi:DNA replicative helicase MCM subunit Mcm2 (Cdc46/Mcm family)
MKVDLRQADNVEKFRDFLINFSREGEEKKYISRIKQMIFNGSTSLQVDWSDLHYMDDLLAYYVLRSPDEALSEFNTALKNVVSEVNPSYVEERKNFFVRIANLPENVSIRSIRSEHVNTLISLEGILVRVSPVKQKMVRASIKHVTVSRKGVKNEESEKDSVRECGAEFFWPPEDQGELGDIIEYPQTCPICGKGGTFKLIPEKSVYIDWQRVVVQERPEEIPPGQIPRSIDVTLTRDLVDLARPGDRITVIGILRVVPPKEKNKTLYDLELEANNILVSQKTLEEVDITREDEEKIIELSKDPWIRKKIIASIAPAIYNHWDEKEAIALALFGGVPKETRDKMRIRGDIHILLIGDPGTAKSQLLQYVSRLAPRAVYTTGKGSSAAGLTAAVIRDKRTGDFYLEAGAMVLADGGVALIDEIDKMREEDRVAIHEAMEQQSYHESSMLELAEMGWIKIGDFVEELMRKGSVKTIGDTVYLEKIPDWIEVKTTDFKEVFTVRPTLISKHKAPNKFYRIKYSNGYEVTVTPEHPVFVLSERGIDIVRADQLKKGLIVPGAPNNGDSTQFPEHLLLKIYRKLMTSIKCPPPYTPLREEISLLIGSCRENMPENDEKKRVLDQVERLNMVSWHSIESIEELQNSGEEWVYDLTVEPTRRFISGGLILHNTVSVAKAGIVARLNARASVVAAGNPKFGRYIPEKTVTDNINLPVTILSRFDLIFILKDKPSIAYDSLLARHMLQVHREAEMVQPEIPLDLLKKYISYARRYVKPVLTDEANKVLMNFFVEMRRMGSEAQPGVVSITPRQLEALIRLAEAHAKMGLRTEVTEEDAYEAIRLMKVFLTQVGYQSDTGVIDIDALMVGLPKTKKEKFILVEDKIVEITNETGAECATIKEIYERVRHEGITEKELEEIIRRMYREGIITEKKMGCYAKA